MYRVIITNHAILSLDRYIRQYEDHMCKPFSDTGLGKGVEDAITINYQLRASELFLGIYDHMIDHLVTVTVLGRKSDTNNPDNFTLITTIQNRTLIIDYHEDIENNTRTITELRIFRE